MTSKPDHDASDRRALVAAFAGHVTGARGGMGAKILGALLVAALIGGAVTALGYMTRPATKHPAAAAATPAAAVTQPVAALSPATSQPPANPAAPAVPVAPVAPVAPLGTMTAHPWPTRTPPAAPRAPAGPGISAGGNNASRNNASRNNGPSFAAVAGYGCRPSPGSTFTERGRWTQGLSGFLSVPANGPRTNGCNGSFDAMPMSGSATTDDPGNYALWTFRTGPITHGVCHIDVYVPNDPSIVHVGGNPAVYQVYGSATASGAPLGSFTIDQPFNRGRWASRHNWRITGGALTVKLLSRGIDWTDTAPTYAHIAISAVSLTCAP